MIAIGLRQNSPQTSKVAQANTLCVTLGAVRRTIGFDPTCRPSMAEMHVHSCSLLCAYKYGCPQRLRMHAVVYFNSARARIRYNHLCRSTKNKIKQHLKISSAHSHNDVHTSPPLRFAINHNLRIDHASNKTHLPSTKENVISEDILLPIRAKQHLHKHSKHDPIEHIREIHTHQKSPAVISKVHIEALQSG